MSCSLLSILGSKGVDLGNCDCRYKLHSELEGNPAFAGTAAAKIIRKLRTLTSLDSSAFRRYAFALIKFQERTQQPDTILPVGRIGTLSCKGMLVRAFG